MIIGRGAFDGRNGYTLRGTFTLTEQSSGEVFFQTSDDFYFGDANGTGTPAPGFALFKGDPTGLPDEVVAPAAIATNFLRLADDGKAVTGVQSGPIGQTEAIDEYDTIFLWCFQFPIVLGFGGIIPEHRPA